VIIIGKMVRRKGLKSKGILKKPSSDLKFLRA
jgi:hypothetical protein